MHPNASDETRGPRRRKRSRFTTAAPVQTSVAQPTKPASPQNRSAPKRSRFAAPPKPSAPDPNLPSNAAQTPLSLSSFKVSAAARRRNFATSRLAQTKQVRDEANRANTVSAFSSRLASDDEHSDDDASTRQRRPFLPPSFSIENDDQIEPSNQPSDAEKRAPNQQVATDPQSDQDPLDSFMATIAENIKNDTRDTLSHRKTDADNQPLQHDLLDADADEENNVERSRRHLPSARNKRQLYEKVDHSRIDYAPFQKELYIEVPEISKMTHAQVGTLRRKLGIRIRGKRCPRPIHSWAQCGLSYAVLSVLQHADYEQPTPIQAQAIPCIMSGRDVIGVARTGSGKTLAYLLPLLRHIALQPRASAGEGPAAVVIAPTRELAIQIHGEAKKFSRAVDVRSVCAYGGSGVKDQIAELKRGADIIICTPGRMIDLLAMNSGRITNLRRATIVVLDEADRMFDMGFEPQLNRIVENIRPDRQTVMFSATFPIQVEKLARKILSQPVEIMAGGNSIAAATIDQNVEVRSEDSKFLRLLELLGHWYDKGSTLVFVDRQDNADRIFRDLSGARYRCLSLHGGMDQADRDSAIVDFKNGDVKVLVATSVAARGLDVKNLTLVVNFDVPNHYEDYVHRVGRTGRAGRAGTAYTFITPEQEAFAPDLAKALTLSARASAEQDAPEGDKDLAKKAADEAAATAVPEELRKLVVNFELKRKAGIVKHGASSGYGGKGFSFENNDEYDAAKNALRKMQAKQYGIDYLADEVANGEGDEEVESDDDDIVAISAAPNASGLVKDGAAKHSSDPRDLLASTNIKTTSQALTPVQVELMLSEAVKRAEDHATKLNLDAATRRANIARAKAQVLSIAATQSKKTTSPPLQGDAAFNAVEEMNSQQRYAAEFEINDYPQHARWQVTRKNSLNDVEEFTGCVITTRGNFYPAGRNPPAGERKLHFLIEGPSKLAVKTARQDIRQKLEEAAAVSRPSDDQYSKYSVV